MSDSDILAGTALEAVAFPKDVYAHVVGILNAEPPGDLFEGSDPLQPGRLVAAELRSLGLLPESADASPAALEVFTGMAGADATVSVVVRTSGGTREQQFFIGDDRMVEASAEDDNVRALVWPGDPWLTIVRLMTAAGVEETDDRVDPAWFDNGEDRECRVSSDPIDSLLQGETTVLDNMVVPERFRGAIAESLAVARLESVLATGDPDELVAVSTSFVNGGQYGIWCLDQEGPGAPDTAIPAADDVVPDPGTRIRLLSPLEVMLEVASLLLVESDSELPDEPLDDAAVLEFVREMRRETGAPFGALRLSSDDLIDQVTVKLEKSPDGPSELLLDPSQLELDDQPPADGS